MEIPVSGIDSTQALFFPYAVIPPASVSVSRHVRRTSTFLAEVGCLRGETRSYVASFHRLICGSITIFEALRKRGDSVGHRVNGEAARIPRGFEDNDKGIFGITGSVQLRGLFPQRKKRGRREEEGT